MWVTIYCITIYEALIFYGFKNQLCYLLMYHLLITNMYFIMSFRNIALDILACISAYDKPKYLINIHLYDEVHVVNVQ